MTEIVQKFAPLVLVEVKKANKILLHCHPSPDPDSVGGALAMMHVLKEMGKDVLVIKGDSDLPAAFSGLPGFSEILPKNISEIDLKEFDLFIIQDSAAPQMVSRINELAFPDSLNTIIIDHHSSNQKYAKINLVDSAYPANCQLLYDLFMLWQVKITPEIAICLFAGIFTDTGGFKYRGVTKETFAVATHLVELAPNFSQIISEIENSNTIKHLEYEALMLGSAKEYFSGQVGLAGVSAVQLQEHKIDPAEINKSGFVLGQLLSVAKWNIVVSMREEKTGEIKISFRSKNQDLYDVSKIAETLGGGGHKSASGLFLKMSFDEAQQKVLNAISAVYPELGKI
jgi:phosphoesterase RecJ-like protein